MQTPLAQICVSPQTCPTPQPPQLFGSLVRSTQAPEQAVYPELQANPHEPPLQTAVACATAVVHGWPQLPQLVRSTFVLVQPPLHRDGAEEGQPDEQAYGPPSTAEGAQKGAPPSGPHVAPHPPQLAAVVYDTHPPSHREKPSSHAKPQPPSAQVVWAFGAAAGHAFPHDPQWPGSEVVSTQPPSQTAGAVSGHVGMQR